MTLLHSRPLLHTAVLLHMNPHQVTAAHFKYSLLQPQNFLVLRILVTFVSTRSRYSRLMVGSTQSSWLRLLRNAEGRVSWTGTQAFPYPIYTMFSSSYQCILVRLIRLYEYVAAVFCFRPCARRSCQCSLSQASSYHPAQLQSNLILHSVHPLREHCVLQPFYDNKLELWWWVSPRLLWSYNPDVLVVLF